MMRKEYYFTLLLALFLLILGPLVIPETEVKAATASNSNTKAYTSMFEEYQKDPKGGSFTLKSTARFYYVSKKAPDSDLKSVLTLLSTEFAENGKPGKTKLAITYGAAEDAKKRRHSHLQRQWL